MSGLSEHVLAFNSIHRFDNSITQHHTASHSITQHQRCEEDVHVFYRENPPVSIHVVGKANVSDLTLENDEKLCRGVKWHRVAFGGERRRTAPVETER